MRGARAVPIFAAMPNLRPVMRRGAVLPVLAWLALAPACGGGGGNGTTDPPEEVRLLAVGIVRLDDSPSGQNLTGFLTFFFDRDQNRLLSAEVEVSGVVLADSILPGIVPGPMYNRGASVSTVSPGTVHRLEATVRTRSGDRAVTSASVTVPSRLEPRAPGTHPLGEDLRIEWDPPPSADGVHVIVLGSDFEVELPATASGVTIPASAFAGNDPGDVIEIEITTFDTFYVSIAGGIGSLGDAEAFAARFTADDDNVEGATGAFGAAVTVGSVVTLE